MTFEHYLAKGKSYLRCGYTTGTCAALATQGALSVLGTGHEPRTLSLITPKGLLVEVVPNGAGRIDKVSAWCSVLKDAGDDGDVTDELEIMSMVRLIPERECRIEGGEGVGRVTRPGLDQPVGASAINSVPRAMIEAQVQAALAQFAQSKLGRNMLDDYRGVEVSIAVPRGREVARRTLNSSLGIEDGISILGTSGIVEPMSSQAFIDTIELELSQVAAEGVRRLLLVPGNYGSDFVKAQGWELDVPMVKCSNYLGEALDAASRQGFREILLVAHGGKLVKVAAGVMNTHSSVADSRMEVLCAYAACAGGSSQLCRSLMEAATVDAAIELLRQAGLCGPVMALVMDAIETHLIQRVGNDISIGAIMFSNVYGVLGMTEQAMSLLASWREGW